MRARVLLLGLVLAIPMTVQGQHIEATRFAVTAVSADTDTVAARNPASRARVFWMRTLLGGVTATAGLAAGYKAGEYYTHKDRRDDWVMSDQEAVGMLIGVVGGAALGAALLDYDSKCSFEGRFLRGTIGAVIGFLPGVLIGPFGPGMGAAAFQGRC